jgi:hypothetical protein
VAFTYKIKPLTWGPFSHGIYPHEYVEANVEVDTTAGGFVASFGSERYYGISLDDAKQWIEEQHIAKVKKYLEEV